MDWTLPPAASFVSAVPCHIVKRSGIQLLCIETVGIGVGWLSQRLYPFISGNLGGLQMSGPFVTQLEEVSSHKAPKGMFSHHVDRFCK